MTTEYDGPHPGKEQAQQERKNPASVPDSYQMKALMLLWSSIAMAPAILIPIPATTNPVLCVAGAAAMTAASLTTYLAADEQYENKSYTLRKSLKSAFDNHKGFIAGLSLVFGIAAAGGQFLLEKRESAKALSSASVSMQQVRP